jgi:hypothetical protein
MAFPTSSFYLDELCIFGVEWTREQYHADPLALRSYPLHFLSGLFPADMSFLRSGAIRSPGGRPESALLA